MSGSDLVPSFVLDESVVGAKHLYDAWRESVRDCYDVNPSTEHNEASESVRAWLVNSLVFSDVILSNQSFRHHSGHLKSANNYLCLQVYRKGVCRGVYNDTSFEMFPGDVHIFDFSRERHSQCSNAASAGVIIPHKTVGYDPGKHPAHFMFPERSPVALLLKQALFIILDESPNLREKDAVSIQNGFCGLLEGVLDLRQADSLETQKTGKARREAMRAYLDRHLTDPDLKVERLSREFSVSIPTIYRDFADSGGVANYVTQRRLDRAYALLVSAPSRYGRVQDVARQFGFDDPAYFSRLFRQRYGFPPSSAMNLNEIGEDQISGKQELAKSTFGEWLKSIAG